MANGNARIDRLQQRARRYWYEDGLTEIAAGCLVVSVGLLFFLEVLAPQLQGSFSAAVLPIIIVIGIWIANRAVAAAKERITYPRTGYVAYRRSKSIRRFVSGLISGMIAVLAIGVFRSWPSLLSQIITLQGLAVGAFLLYLGHTLGLSRFYGLAILSAVIGVAASLAGLGDTLGMAAYYCALGGALIVSGGLTLRDYLRLTRPPMKD